jgi:hypothetical protein
MTQIEINGSDNDTLRVVHLDLPREAVERFVTQAGTGEWPVKYALGATELRSDFVDVVDIRDLGDMPLSAYLMSAHGVTKAALAADRDMLDGLTGHVLLLPAQSFARVSQTLTISPPLRFVGTYGEVKPKGRGATVSSQSAQGGAGGASGMGAEPAASPVLKYVLIAIAIVVVLAMVLVI